MAKDAYYFSHDSNARQDPKILEMMSVYGSEGYGWYWILVEMLREQADYKLKLKGKYTFNALAMQMQCKPDASERFVLDCVNEFELFISDDMYFWSESLIRRMSIREEVSQKRKKAAEARWGKKSDTPTILEDDDANGMQMHSKSNANGMQGKERKGKERKLKETKKQYAEYVSMKPEEYEKLIETFGKDGTEERIENLNLYKGSKGVKYKSDYMTILGWERKNKKQQGNPSTVTKQPSIFNENDFLRSE